MERYEEKYKQALEIAKECLQDGTITTIARDYILEIFPELKEKESEDERIMKDIIRILKGETSYTSKEDTDRYVTWLEKQGEKKPADKVEPKFKVGDFIADDYCSGKIIGITNDAYLLDTGQGISFSYEHNAHLWTIKDARDGDVLVAIPPKGSESNEQIFLFKAINSRDYVDNCIEYYCRLCGGTFYKNKTGYMGTTLDTFYPATKKQRDLFFQKMKKEGYKWDSKKKELKKIESKKLDADKVIEWITANVSRYASLEFLPGGDCPQGDVEVESLIKSFKKEFGL